jgi:hypothetical protein
MEIGPFWELALSQISCWSNHERRQNRSGDAAQHPRTCECGGRRAHDEVYRQLTLIAVAPLAGDGHAIVLGNQRVRQVDTALGVMATAE